MDQQEKQQRRDKPAIPLSLEDSCLAWLVNDLENYSLESLALLPLRLRYRLLANLPVLDLCQLERTSVALGVDLESIWKLKFPPWNDVQVESKLTTDDSKRAPLSDPSSSTWLLPLFSVIICHTIVILLNKGFLCHLYRLYYHCGINIITV